MLSSVGEWPDDINDIQLCALKGSPGGGDAKSSAPGLHGPISGGLGATETVADSKTASWEIRSGGRHPTQAPVLYERRLSEARTESQNSSKPGTYLRVC